VQPHDGTARIAYIDGLRGVAIGMVLVFHAWYHYLQVDFATYRPRTPLDGALLQGSQGVSLFLVISGFCLAFPLLQRQAAGASDWFRPSVFFARRALRILPPYYVALCLFVGWHIVFATAHWPQLPFVGAPLTRGNLLSHLLLVHNLTPYRWAINGSFWSLGLEWQWYGVFPPLLVWCARSPRAALACCLAGALLWHVGTHDLWQESALPARLFEFCCGVAVARMIVRRTRVSRRLLLLTLLALVSVQVPLVPLVARGHGARLINLVLHPIATLGLAQPLWGVIFAAVLLLGYYSRAANTLLSWRPLVALGVVSYSVYLVHEPVLQGVEAFGPPGLRHSLLMLPIALSCALASGVIFHLCIERPCMRRSTWQRLAPALLRLFAWTDALWAYLAAGGRLARAVHE
jgi:peptidoglycan/LPS O-acetylase OafA/YrhL